ncbi:unnamed protein product [Eruca vesicaria subsp. sativa]|uniref:non-specific serine/threonine protein kinase n=1 Tax=Eruca vesicaria subsp. sativa TaxID=29727 RepID=A0ABC8LJM5_ERUVS|nr:unnamed protein product [Eruca vesicaria subsp. sativa]
MSRKLGWWMVMLIIALSNTKYSHCKLVWEGSIGLIDGFTSLTNTKKHAYGQAFDDEILTLKNNFTNGTVPSFSVTFFFAIVPEHKHKGSHGMAFVISPTRGIPGASADQYLGIFNKANNGNSSNHIIAVELDIHKDDEFGDIDDNHVGININNMRSIKSAPAGYFDKDGQFRNISLISGKLLRVTILYNGEKKQLNVTLSSPEEAYYPEKPLLSLNQDLSPYVLENMYMGFSASTGLVGAMHYMWTWFVLGNHSVPDLDFPIPTFPPYPNPNSQVKRTVLVTVLTFALFVALVASASSIFFYKRHKMVKEVLEEWEIQCGPHRFSYKELFKATKGFNDKQILGRGGFGQVFKGTLPASERLRGEQIELVLKLGVLCSHQVATIRPDMSVIKILNGDVQLPDNLLDIVKAEKIRMWSEITYRGSTWCFEYTRVHWYLDSYGTFYLPGTLRRDLQVGRVMANDV